MYAILRRSLAKFRFKDISKSCNFDLFSGSALQYCYRSTTTKTGLYGFDHLKTPKGFQCFVDDTIKRCGELVNHVSVTSSPAEIIQTVDEILYKVDSVIYSTRLCVTTHPNSEFVEEARKASLRIYEYKDNLYTNPKLYAAVKKAEQEGVNVLSKEAYKAAECFCGCFEGYGMHLSSEKQDRLKQLDSTIRQLYREFDENMKHECHVYIEPTSRIPRDIHHLFNPILGYKSSGSSSESSGLSRPKVEELGWILKADPLYLRSVLSCTSDDEFRKILYIQGNSVPRANIEVLKKLVAASHEYAQIMGYRSLAEYETEENMASSPKVIMSFLNKMSKMVKQKANEEFKTIRNFKREKCGKKCIDLEPWDKEYYTTTIESSTFDLDSLDVKSYFPLKQCIEGLKILVNSLFGATFHEVPMAPGESWHQDVMKMCLHHPEEGDLGYIYLDLLDRGGKKLDTWSLFEIKSASHGSKAEYQLPASAIVCDFTNPSSSSPVRLCHAEVIGLFHEFGHALHWLLSRTDYHYFSGTQVELDFLEMPSALFEYYASDYRVLRTFAKHYSTGEIIPEKLVKSMQAARDMFAAINLQEDIFFALATLTLFGEQPSSPQDITSIVADLQGKYTMWKHVEGTHPQIRIQHLTSYGIDQYTYLYGACFAATVWEKICKEDPLSLATGTALRTKLLQHGGAKDPDEILKDLVGEGIVRDCKGGIVPDMTCFFNESKWKMSKDIYACNKPKERRNKSTSKSKKSSDDKPKERKESKVVEKRTKEKKVEEVEN